MENTKTGEVISLQASWDLTNEKVVDIPVGSF